MRNSRPTRQTQGGLIYERRIDASNAIRLLAYLGHRDIEQFQSIPVSTQSNPLHPGGVILPGRDYRGTDLHLFARTYAGSVIVNEGDSRFFEPAPGRTWLASASATLKFRAARGAR